MASPEAVCNRAVGGPRDPLLRVTMTRASNKVAARSWRECRTTASTGPGRKSPRWSAERRASRRWERREPDRAPACRSWHAETGASHAPGRLRRSAISSSGWQMKKRKASRKRKGEKGETRNEKRETRNEKERFFVGWAKAPDGCFGQHAGCCAPCPRETPSRGNDFRVGTARKSAPLPTLQGCLTS